MYQLSSLNQTKSFFLFSMLFKILEQPYLGLSSKFLFMYWKRKTCFPTCPASTWFLDSWWNRHWTEFKWINGNKENILSALAGQGGRGEGRKSAVVKTWFITFNKLWFQMTSRGQWIHFLRNKKKTLASKVSFLNLTSILQI